MMDGNDAQFVYYQREDYASARRRVGAFLIDLFVTLMSAALLSTTLAKIVIPPDVQQQMAQMPEGPAKQRIFNTQLKPYQVPMTVGWWSFCLSYHIPLRKSRGGTVGYRLMSIRLIDETNRPPRWRVLFKRFAVAVPSTLAVGASYFFCRKRPKRQAFHDELAGTWLVRKSATPAGPARVTYLTRLFGTFPITYIDVEPVETEVSAALRMA